MGIILNPKIFRRIFKEEHWTYISEMHLGNNMSTLDGNKETCDATFYMLKSINKNGESKMDINLYVPSAGTDDEMIKFIVNKMEKATILYKSKTNERSYKLMSLQPIIQEFNSVSKEIAIRRENEKLILNLNSKYCGVPNKDFIIEGRLYTDDNIEPYIDLLVKESEEIAKRMKDKYKYI